MYSEKKTVLKPKVLESRERLLIFNKLNSQTNTHLPFSAPSEDRTCLVIMDLTQYNRLSVYELSVFEATIMCTCGRLH